MAYPGGLAFPRYRLYLAWVWNAKLLIFRVMRNLLFPVFWVFVSSVHAEWVSASAEHLYGPEMSENAACQLAEDKAKAMALSRISGEAVSAEEQLLCKATTGKLSDSQCEFNRVTWSLIEGDIKGFKLLNQQRALPRDGARACVVSLLVDVVVPTKKPDPNFDLRVAIERSIFKVGDVFNVDIESTEPAYLAIFNWLPNENNQVYRVLNPQLSGMGDAALLKKNVYGKIDAHFGLTAAWSEAYKNQNKLYDEWLIVIASKKPYKWLSVYELDQFKEKLREIPIDERRIVRRGYQLMK